MTNKEIIAKFHHQPELSVDFDLDCWRIAQRISISHQWNGDPSPPELKTTAMVLWSREALFFGYECEYTELDVDEEFDLSEERYALWDRDVCEAFVRSPLEPDEKVYKEFEVAPTGQWIDLKIDRRVMLADWQWRSGMRTAAKIDHSKKIWRAVMSIPFEAFGCSPGAGDIWHANLFRCARFKGERQYLAYSPTLTENPNFHVAEKFAGLIFQIT
ncbi:MAG: carbohydrate-binding family 9-like protein [Acidobacteria bacterium]|nr:carbohydrate-binding family 9-like protein [Acidobacteriota bacterium]